MNRIHKQKKGFTIMELLIVLVVIGIISSLAVPGYKKATEKSNVAEAIVGLRAAEMAARERLMPRMRFFETSSLEDLHFSLSAGKMNSAGQWETKNWTFSIKSKNSGGGVSEWTVAAARNSERPYYLYTKIRPGANGVGLTVKHECKGTTNIGKYMCKYLAAEGW